MINGEKYVNGSWTTAEIPTRKLHNKTDIITSLPVDIYTDGQSASANIIGNMSQSGTPTPTSPITPSETGEMTGNLVYSSQTQTVGADLQISQTIDSSEYILNKSVTGTAVSTATLCDLTLQAGEYTITVNGINQIASDNTFDRVFIRDSDNNIVVQDIYNNTPKTFTLSATTTLSKIVFVAHQTSTYNNNKVTIMLNSGTAKPYEPYGYKLDIKSGSTTTPVYLGQVQSTRKIYKLVLTGQEDWKELSSSTAKHYLTLIVPDYLRAENQITYICSHYVPIGQTSSAINVNNLQISFAFSTTAQRLYITDATYTTNDAWKAYLAQQYANGTPVTVWYVLATETTGIVNEPIRKIGSYSDSVSVANIPTTSGGIEFDVDTTLKPSEVDLTYHGWHDISPLQRVNGEWV